jgi:rare lipoprotein A
MARVWWEWDVMRKSVAVTCVVMGLGLALSGCSSKSYKSASSSRDPFAGKGSPYYPGKGPIPIGGGKYHVGKPYQVAGLWFTPKEQPNYNKVGVSSWYGEAFHRRRTSNGEYFDMNQLTAAHATLPIPSYVQVTNLENNKTAILRLNDRGPFVGTRIIDVSKRAADVLGYKHKGTQKVRVKYMGPAPLEDFKGQDLMAMNRRLGTDAPAGTMLADDSSMTKRRKRGEPVQVASAESDDNEGFGEPIRSYAYYVQLGSFADPDNVNRIREGLSETGPMQMAEFNGQGGTVYKLRVGPLPTPEAAQTALNEALNFGLPDAEVVQAPRQQASLR